MVNKTIDQSLNNILIEIEWIKSNIENSISKNTILELLYQIQQAKTVLGAQMGLNLLIKELEKKNEN